MTSFSTFTVDTLLRIIDAEGIPVAETNPKKGELVDHVNNFVAELGFNIFSSELKKDELQDAAKHLKLDTSDVKNPTKNYLRRRLQERAVELGLEKFFGHFTDNKDLLAAFADTCGLEETKPEKEVAGKIAKEVQSVGAEALYERLDTPTLRDLVEEAKLKVDKAEKARFVEALVSGKNVKGSKNDALAKANKAAEKEAKAAAKGDKPDIKKGVTYQGIFQHYGREEIFAWVKDNGLKTSGNKKDLIKRILAYLDGDKETTVAKPKEAKEKKEKKEAPKKEKKATEKKTTEKKKTTKKSDDKKKDDKKEESDEKKN